jgi:hypothetical protein
MRGSKCGRLKFRNPNCLPCLVGAYRLQPPPLQGSANTQTGGQKIASTSESFAAILRSTAVPARRLGAGVASDTSSSKTQRQFGPLREYSEFLSFQVFQELGDRVFKC